MPPTAPPPRKPDGADRLTEGAGERDEKAEEGPEKVGACIERTEPGDTIGLLTEDPDTGERGVPLGNPELVLGLEAAAGETRVGVATRLGEGGATADRVPGMTALDPGRELAPEDGTARALAGGTVRPLAEGATPDAVRVAAPAEVARQALGSPA
jgi:hypothetical protein